MRSPLLLIVYLTCAFDTTHAATDTADGATDSSSSGASPSALEQTGASIYTNNEAAITAQPGGDNQLLNQVIMQAPDVAQDSFGGWKPHSVNPGDKVKVSVNPLRDGTHGGRLMSIFLADGKTLSGQGGEPARAAGASSTN